LIFDRYRSILDIMTRFTIAFLRILLLLIAVGALFAQVRLVPIIATGLTEDAGHPEAGVAYAAAGILAIACGEVVLVALWVLLSYVRRGSIFTRSAFRWVDAILWAGIACTAVLLLLAAHVALVVEPPLDAPGLTVIAGALVVGALTSVLLMTVMRGLLRSAAAMQSELADVV
jgi:hypothetical protein